MERFKLIDVGLENDVKPRKAIEHIVCRHCNSTHFIKTKMAPMIKKGKVTGGTDAMICVYCLESGKVHREI